MREISPDLISGKTVLLRYDIDVPIKNRKVVEDFRLRAGLATLKLCLENAQQVILMGHIGRPGGKEVPELSVEPIYDWLATHDDLRSHLESGKLKLLENLRFEPGEEACSLEYAKEILKQVQDDGNSFYVNEAFSAHHKAASTTVLPTLLPHAAGLRFAEEVKSLTEVRENPKKPLVVIIGGVKLEDKLPAIDAMSKIADYVLVGGKIVAQLGQTYHDGGTNVQIGDLTDDGMDISQTTIEEWQPIIQKANMIVWNGPLGKFEEERYTEGTKKIAEAVISSDARPIIGGGDTISAISTFGLLCQFEKKGILLVGGGASLKFLELGTLPTIE